MYKIQEAEMLANNIYRMVVEAPRVAQQMRKSKMSLLPPQSKQG